MFGASADSPFPGGRSYSAGAGALSFGEKHVAAVKPGEGLTPAHETERVAADAKPAADKPVDPAEPVKTVQEVKIQRMSQPSTPARPREAPPVRQSQPAPPRAPAAPPPASYNPPGNAQQRNTDRSGYEQRNNFQQYPPVNNGKNKSPGRFVALFLLVTVAVFFLVLFLVLVYSIAAGPAEVVETDPPPVSAQATMQAPVPIDDLITAE